MRFDISKGNAVICGKKTSTRNEKLHAQTTAEILVFLIGEHQAEIVCEDETAYHYDVTVGYKGLTIAEVRELYKQAKSNAITKIANEQLAEMGLENTAASYCKKCSGYIGVRGCGCGHSAPRDSATKDNAKPEPKPEPAHADKAPAPEKSATVATANECAAQIKDLWHCEKARAVEMFPEYERTIETLHLEFDESRRAIGSANYKRQCVTMSLFFAPYTTEAEKVDTLRHEIAHHLARAESRRHGLRIKPHGKEWKAWARRIGCTPKASSKEAADAPRRAPNWACVCREPSGELSLVCKYKRRPGFDLSRRHVRGRPETSGQLFYVSWAQWEAYQENRIGACDCELVR